MELFLLRSVISVEKKSVDTMVLAVYYFPEQVRIYQSSTTFPRDFQGDSYKTRFTNILGYI